MFLQARPHHIMRQGGLQHIIIWAMEAATNYNVKLHPEVISDITRERERERERESASLSSKRAHMFHADYMDLESLPHGKTSLCRSVYTQCQWLNAESKSNNCLAHADGLRPTCFTHDKVSYAIAKKNNTTFTATQRHNES